MATYRRLTLEMRLAEWHLDTGDPESKAGTVLLAVELVCPRPTVARRGIVRELHRQGPGDNAGLASWPDALLFKEPVQGPVGMIVRMSGLLSNKVLNEIAGTVSNTLAREAASVFADAVGGTGGMLLRAPVLWAAGRLSQASKVDPPWIAEGWTTVEAMELRTTGTVTVELKAPRDNVRLRRTTRAGRTTTRRTTIHKAGDQNGRIVFGVRIYE